MLLSIFGKEKHTEMEGKLAFLRFPGYLVTRLVSVLVWSLCFAKEIFDSQNRCIC